MRTSGIKRSIATVVPKRLQVRFVERRHLYLLRVAQLGDGLLTRLCLGWPKVGWINADIVTLFLHKPKPMSCFIASDYLYAYGWN